MKRFLLHIFVCLLVYANGVGAQTISFTSTPVESVHYGERYIYPIAVDQWYQKMDQPIAITAPILPSWLSFQFGYVSTFVSSLSSQSQIMADNLGNIYVKESASVKKINSGGQVVSTYEGLSGAFTVNDASTIYTNINDHIVQIEPDGSRKVLAGSSAISGHTDGLGSAATFDNISQLTAVSTGSLFILEGNYENSNNIVRKISADGNVSTILNFDEAVQRIAADDKGNLYILMGFQIMVINPDNPNVQNRYISLPYSDLGGPVNDMAVDIFDNVYLTSQHRIFKITPDGGLKLMAGGDPGYIDGIGTAAQFNNPSGIAADQYGNVYVADKGNNKIRKIAPALTGIAPKLEGVYEHEVLLRATAYRQTIEQHFWIRINDNIGPKAPSLSPVNNAKNIGSYERLILTFDENIRRGVGFVYIKKKSIDSIVEKIDITNNNVTISGKTLTIHPSKTLPLSTDLYVTIDSASITDEFNNPYIGINDNITWAFQTAKGLSVLTYDPAINAANISSDVTFTLDFDGPINKGLNSNITIKRSADHNIIESIKVYSQNVTVSGNTLKIKPSSFLPYSTNLYITIDPTAIKDLSNNPFEGISTPDIWYFKTQEAPLSLINTKPAPNASQIQNNETLTLTFNKAIKKGDGYVYIKKNSDNTVIEKINIADDNIKITDKQLNIKPSLALPSLTKVYVTIDLTAIKDLSGEAWPGISDKNTWTFTTKQGPPTFASLPSLSIGYGNTYTYIPVTTAESGKVTITAPTLSSWLKLNITSEVSTLAGSSASGFADGSSGSAKFNYPAGVAMDASGNVYVADSYNHRIRKVDPSGTVSTFAGSGTAGYTNGAGTTARFKEPYDVAVDASGNVYVADYGNHSIRKITPYGVVSTFAGSGTAGYQNGTGTSAQFRNPKGIAVDASGNVYVSDAGNHIIRKISKSGSVRNLAGTRSAGFKDGAGTVAQFNDPYGIAVDGSGVIYVADSKNHSIRKITSSGVVSTLAGTRSAGFKDGAGTVAQFNVPHGITADNSGTIYVADAGNHRIRKITSAGVVSTLAGSGTAGMAAGAGPVAKFYDPSGIAEDATGNLFVADYGNNRIRKLVTDVAVLSGTPSQNDQGSHAVVLKATNSVGSTTQSFAILVKDQTLPVVTAYSPVNNAKGVNNSENLTLTFDEYVKKGVGSIYIKRSIDNSIVEQIDVASIKVTVSNKIVMINPSATLPSLTQVYVTIDKNALQDVSGNAYAGITSSDTWTFETLKMAERPVFTSKPNTIANVGERYTYTVRLSGDRSNLSVVTFPSWLTMKKDAQVSTMMPAKSMGVSQSPPLTFNTPFATAVDGYGNVYVADTYNHRICKISPSGIMTVLAGSGKAGFLDAQGEKAQFDSPMGLAVDALGNVYVADNENDRIRKITPSGLVTTFAGKNTGYQNGTGSAASFYGPSGIALDADGNIYVSDTYNRRIRKISKSGVVSTIAGNGTLGYKNGSALSAEFHFPMGLTVTASGDIYVADQMNNCIRMIDKSGSVTTIAGRPDDAAFNNPSGVVADASGNLYIADQYNHSIRMVDAVGRITPLVGRDRGNVDGSSTSAKFAFPVGLSADSEGNLYVADKENNSIRKISFEYLLAGTPAKAHVGSHPVELKASNAISSTNQSFIIEVKGEIDPKVTAYTPANKATNILKDAKLILNFDEAVQKGSGSLYIKKSSDNSIVEKIDINSTNVKIFNVTTGINNGSVTITPSKYLPLSTKLYVTIDPTAIKDIMGSDYAGINDKNTWTFETVKQADVPLFTSTAITEAFYNRTYSYTIKVSGAAPLTLTAPVLPDWLTLLQPGDVSTLAGTGKEGSTDGTAATASFNSPYATAVDAAGNVYVADKDNHSIRQITPDGLVSTIAGSGTPGFKNATGSEALFNQPSGIAIDALSKYLYVADSKNNRIRKIDIKTGQVGVVAGAAEAGYKDGTGSNARFNSPKSIAIDASGNLYVSDLNNFRVRKITPAGVVSTLAGNEKIGNADGQGALASFFSLSGIAVDASANILVADALAGTVRKITSSGYVTTLIRNLSFPSAIAIDASGDIYVSEQANGQISKISKSGAKTTFAGTTQGFADGKNQIARFSSPMGIAIDARGNLYVADNKNNRIRKITNELLLTGTPSTLAPKSNAVTLKAVNASGDAEQTFTIRIDKPVIPTLLAIDHIVRIADSVAIANLDSDRETDVIGSSTPMATNIISPNGDGINDSWEIANIEKHPDNEVKIFDKSGSLLFSQKGYSNLDGWKGMFNGSLLTEGTYYYIIDIGGKAEKVKGFITLVRN